MRFEYRKETISNINQNLTVRIMLPNGYDATEKRYPVLYHHDGQDIFNDKDSVFGDSLQYEQYYNEYGRFMPDIILVAIDCPEHRAERTRLYSPYTKHFNTEGKNFEPYIEGQGKEYLQWITNILKPSIDSSYRTLATPEFTGIGGSSTAGLISTYALLCYPDVFTRGLLMSSAYYIWYDLLQETLSSKSATHIKSLYMDLGTNEFGRMTTAEQFLQGNDFVYEYFLSEGLNSDVFKYTIYPDDTHTQICWKRRFPDAIRWIFKDFI